MSYSTYLQTTIEFQRKTYSNLSRVLDDIDDARHAINSAKETLRNLAFITEPQKFCGKDDDPMIWLKKETNDALDYLAESLINLYELQILRDSWDDIQRDGDKFVPAPHNKSYLEGDFIPSTEEDDDCI